MHQSWAAGFIYQVLRISVSRTPRAPISTEAFR
jgi:hypothetical protein